MRILVFAVVVASCAKSNTVECGDLTCPPGYVCSPSGDRCATPAQLTACTGVAEMGTCTADGDPGVCQDGFCMVVRCGDGVTDPGEICDDGNTVAFDGCSSDCKSNEMCGNGVVDDPVEACDDGNTATNDGCNASCRDEAPIWHEITDTAFQPRQAHTMAYDSVRARVVLFGGSVPGGLSDETWEFDGDAWLPRMPAHKPPAREYAAMAYDANRQRTVLFGGRNPADLGDIWEWDGTDWTERTFAGAKPTARHGATLAYHPGRNLSVLYGGVVNGVQTNETWEYNGTTWTLYGGTPNGASAFRTMAYEAITGQLVTMDGSGNVHRYDTSWTVGSFTGTKRGRMDYAVAYDASLSALVFVGGFGDQCAGSHCGDALELASTGSSSYAWTPLLSPFTPKAAAAAYHTASQQLVVMGGVVPGSQDASAATWLFEGGAWNQLATPPQRLRCQLAYLPSQNGSVLFGGVPTYSGPFGSDLDDTWLLRDGRWTRVRTQNSPPKTSFGAMALDRMRGVLVLVDTAGGTWELGGTPLDWSPITTADKPSARQGHALAYDETRHAIVLHGGFVGVTPQSDTWTYDGTNWTLLPVATPPPARGGHGMTYDVARGSIVVFGGSNGATELADSYELTGTMWAPISGTAPSPRLGPAMAYHRKRGSSIVFGGGVPAKRLDETWELGDGQWTQVTTPAPLSRWYACATYDEALDEIVVVGGTRETIAGSPGRTDTWSFGYE